MGDQSATRQASILRTCFGLSIVGLLAVGIGWSASYDISVSKSANRSFVTAGQTVQYTLTLNNGGPDSAVGSDIVDYLDENIVYQNDLAGSCAYTDSSININGDELTIEGISLSAATNCTLTYSVVVGSAPADKNWLLVPGSVTGIQGMSWQSVSFAHTYESVPIILTTPVTANNSDNYPIPVVRNVTTTGFEIAVCVDDGNDTCAAAPAAEDIDYVIVNTDLVDQYNWIDAGTTTADTDGTNTAIGFGLTFANTPVLWASAQTYSQGGNLGATVWADDQGNTSANLLACVHHDSNTNNCETAQPQETIGWLAIDVVAASLDNFSGGTVSISNSNWTPVTYGPVASPHLIVTTNDDSNNQDPKYPWARNKTSTGADVRYCEQDGANDCDSHPSELTAWMMINAIASISVDNRAVLTDLNDTDSTNNSDTLALNLGVCGNGIVDGNETCDDANAIDGDGCPNDCGVCVDNDSDGSCAVDDCDDNDANELPGQTWYLDGDTDGYSNGTTQVQCLRPANYYTAGELTNTTGDCDDTDVWVHPATTWYKDVDGDDYSDGTSQVQCARPTNYYLSQELTSTSTDCNDSDVNQYPGQVWYKDVDGDDYSDGTSVTQCARPANYYLSTELTATSNDCDDNDANEYPGQVWYLEADGDGYSEGTSATQCARPTYYKLVSEITSTSGDCNDSDANEYPGQIWYKDADTDLYSDGSNSTQCARPTDYYLSGELTATGGDCNDSDANEYPGQTWYKNYDGDQYSDGTSASQCSRLSGYSLAGELIATNGDCDDTNASINPAKAEVCDSIDNNCNAQIDENGVCSQTFCTLTGINIPTTECDALQAYFISLNGNGRTNGTNWLQDLDVDTWYGVDLVTVSGQQHVYSIDMSSNNVVGTIPTEIGDLDYLALLNLDDNTVVSVDAGIGGASSLITLSLDDNDIATLPAAITSLTNLSVLSIDNNELTQLPTDIGNLTDLDLLSVDNNSLTSLPSSISGLADLDTLSVTNNDLTGLPSGIGQLTDLDTLRASFNSIITLPTQLTNLTSLSTLLLNNNSITSLPTDIGDLTILQTLEMNNNALTTLPSSFGSLGSLQTALFQNNSITSLPDTLNGLSALTTFDIRNNSLSTLPDTFGDLSSLVTFYGQNNSIVTLPSTLDGLTSLVTLHLNDNQINALPASVGGLGGLTYFYMYNNEMLGTIPLTYTGLNVFRFYIYNNNLDRDINPVHNASIPSALSSWYSSLAAIKLINNQSDITAPVVTSTYNLPLIVTGSFTYQISVVENSYAVNNAGDGMSVILSGSPICANLNTSFEITGKNVTVDLPLSASVTGLYQNCTIQVVDHAGNVSAAHTIDEFVYGSQLKDMCLHSSITVPQIECEALIKLYETAGGDSWQNKTNWLDSTEIETWFGVRTNVYDGQEHVDGLFLHKNSGADGHGASNLWVGNNLNGTIPAEIGNLSKLKDLNLSKNSISGVLPATLGNVSTLETFYAIDNNIAGTIPVTFGNLVNLEVLNLSDNAIGGSLPSQISNMVSLQAVDLSINQLTNALPSTWAGLTSLWFLRLNNNNFTDGIPDDMGSLSALEYLYLNNNSFEGALPQTFVNLNNITDFFVQGNYLNRDANHNALLPGALAAWYLTFNSKNIGNQSDITAPIWSYTGSLAAIYTGPVDISVVINENSYAIDLLGDGMTVSATGDGYCTTLPDSELNARQGVQTVTLSPSQAGTYSGCVLTVTDHGGNESNSITLPSFTYTDPASLICFDLNISIPESECLALITLYKNTGGTGWTTNTNWLSDANVNGWYGVTTTQIGGSHHVTDLQLDSNNLIGTLSVDFGELPYLELIDFSSNSLEGNLPTSIASLDDLIELDLQANSFDGSIPAGYNALTNLEQLNLSNNALDGSIPTLFGNLTSLISIDLSYNQLVGDVPSWLGDIAATIDLINFEHNRLSGPLPDELEQIASLTLFDVSDNYLNRDNNHNATVQPILNTLLFSNTNTLDLTNQEDDIAPVVTSNDSIPSSVTGAIFYDISIEENSYAIDSGGNGMVVSFGGTLNCTTLNTAQRVEQNSGTVTLVIVPVVEGNHLGCQLRVTDHAGNVGIHIMPNFEFEVGCGDGIIAGSEVCDEGRSCDDGTDCTNNISLCPTECQPRFVDGCNPQCQASACGDGYIDADGIDNTTGTADDEVCDEGSYCNDGTDCTNNPGVCLGGASECQPRLINDCTPGCLSPECGDGVRDVNGPDNIVGTVDDEQCDDGNVVVGDGCSASCKIEECGDGYIDADGPDNTQDTEDDEVCDLGANNGVFGGLCTHDCQDPSDRCQPCWSICEGGTGANSIYLLVDRSGSMNGFERLDEWKDAAIEFVSLLPEPTFDGSGTWISGSKIGLISFSNSAQVEIAPTFDYTGVVAAISGLTAGAQSNMSEAIDLAQAYFDTNDLEAWHYIVLLSDGEPSQPGGKNNAETAALASAAAAKGSGTRIFTVALQQGTNGAELLSGVSSGPNYFFEDPDNEILTPIYQHIYGAIHCYCKPNEIICYVCGNEVVDPQVGEECDGGSYCDDLVTECTDDPNICPSPDECRPRFTGNCTNECLYTHCGDGVIQTPNYTGINEQCDDGNTTPGDGCSVTCQTESCGDGYLDDDGADNIWGNSDDEQCDDGNNIDDDGCSATCVIENPAICGDGLVNQPGEECDDGNNDDGDGCTSTCLHETPLEVPGAQSNSCIVGTLPTVMVDELLPLWWTLIPRTNVDTSATDCNDIASGKYIPGGEMLCDFKIINHADPINGVTTISDVPCVETTWNGAAGDLFDEIPKNESYAPVLGNTYLQNLSVRVQGNYGQYEFVMDEITYTVCNRDAGGGLQEDSVTINGNICHMRTTILNGYMLQQGSILTNVPNTSFSGIKNLSGDIPTPVTSLGTDSVAEQTYDQQATNYLFNQIVSKYTPLATASATVYNTDVFGITKVPNEEIYLYAGANPITVTDQIVYTSEPYTLIVTQADLIIEGSLPGRGMYVVPQGTISFNNEGGSACDQTDIVRGIFIAGDGFETTTQRNTSPTSDDRCNGGNLVVEGMLLGPGIDSNLPQNRRARLDLWDNSFNMFANDAYTLGHELFMNTYKPWIEGQGVQNMIDMTDLQRAFEKVNVPLIEQIMTPLAPNITLQPLDRDAMILESQTNTSFLSDGRQRLYDGAAVLIKTDPSIWDNLPPGAGDYWESILITK